MGKGKVKIVMVFLLVALLSLGCKGKGGQQAVPEPRRVAEKSNIEELTAQTFREKIVDYEKGSEWDFRGEKPAIIDFYATWCGPCKRMAPVLDSIAGEYKGRINVYKVDIDKQEELAGMFGIRSIPSLLFIPMEGKPQMQVGALGRPDLERNIQTFLLPGK